jgi:Zn-dependent protease with chaperone function
MRFPFSSISACLCQAICVTGLLVWAHGAWASDGHEAGAPREAASSSASSVVQPAPQTPSASEAKSGKTGKYDVDRIGNRDVGRGLNLYSLQRERALGEAMAAATEHGTRFIVDPVVNDYISRLGNRIVSHSDAQVPFTFKIIDSPNLRMFALPGGFLYVDKGLIIEVDSEAELAGLMAHEIAHVAARHATRFATRRYAWRVLTVPLMYLSGPAAIGTRQIVPLTLGKFNRDAEFEADLLGLQYQYAAGYDPQAFLDVLEKLYGREMRARSRTGQPAFKDEKTLRHQLAGAFANYPPGDERIRKAQLEISTLLPNRDDYVVDTSEFQDVRARLMQTDQPILRRHRGGGGPSNPPVLNRRPAQTLPENNLAGAGTGITKDPMSFIFGYLPAFR